MKPSPARNVTSLERPVLANLLGALPRMLEAADQTLIYMGVLWFRPVLAQCITDVFDNGAEKLKLENILNVLHGIMGYVQVL